MQGSLMKTTDGKPVCDTGVVSKVFLPNDRILKTN